VVFSEEFLVLLPAICLVVIGHFLAIGSARQLRRILVTRDCSLRRLFHNFNEKMWITLGIGTTFVTLFFVLNLLGRWLVDEQLIEFLLKQGPANLSRILLFALALVIVNSLFIYMVRMCIVTLYFLRK
jgi:hypothetical protein